MRGLDPASIRRVILNLATFVRGASEDVTVILITLSQLPVPQDKERPPTDPPPTELPPTDQPSAERAPTPVDGAAGVESEGGGGGGGSGGDGADGSSGGGSSGSSATRPQLDVVFEMKAINGAGQPATFTSVKPSNLSTWLHGQHVPVGSDGSGLGLRMWVALIAC